MEIAVVKVAVQNALPVLVFCAPLVGVQVTGAPRLVEPFENCTVPVTPAPLLLEEIFAVRVTLVPEVIEPRLDVTAVVVAAFVTVIERGVVDWLLL